MRRREQNSTSHPILFFMADEEDHMTGLTGLTPSVTISKDGGAFASAEGAVSEVGNGWYALAGDADDRDTLGTLIIHAEAAGADTFDMDLEILASDPPTQEEIRAEMDANSTKLAHLDTDISSRLAAEDYTEPPSEDDIAARITEDHGPGAYGSGVGLQLKEYTLTQEGTPVAGVACWVTSDAAGLIRISPVRQTNSLGKVVFQLDVPVGTTVYIWYQGATTGDAEVV